MSNSSADANAPVLTTPLSDSPAVGGATQPEGAVGEPAAPAASVTVEPIELASQTALNIIALISVTSVFYIAADLLLPILVAAMVALLLNTPVRFLSQRWVPRWVAASLVLVTALGGLTLAVNGLYEPAMQVATDSPRTAQELKRRLSAFSHSFAPADAVDQAMATIEEIGAEPAPREVTVVEDERGLSKRYGGTFNTLATVLMVTVLVFLFLVYGELLLRRIVVVAPTLSDKRNTVSVVRGIQSEVSRYVGTITVINVGLGTVVAVGMYLLGVPDPLLWGVVAALLNFAPFVGPFIGVLLLLGVGLLQFESNWYACAPAGVYLLIHGIESQLVTPVVLGRNFALNPVVIVLWLLFWAWLWGLPGVLLAMPLLVCGKIICLRSERLRPWMHILEG